MGELRDHAVPLQQARARPPLPHRAGRAREDRQRDVLPDRDAVSARRQGHVPDAWASLSTRARSRTSDADDAIKARAQEQAAAAIAAPLDVYREFFLGGKPFIGGDQPSIADIRLAATLEFLRAIDYDFPAWAEEYMTAIESTLGEAYSEPAEDVRGFVASVKS